MSLLQISLSSVLGAKNCPVGADQAFGPSISQRCRGFDFTMMFEQTILSILPSSIFLILVVCRSYYLHGSTVKIGPNYLGAFKAVKFLCKPRKALELTLHAGHSHCLCCTSVVTSSSMVHGLSQANFGINSFSRPLPRCRIDDMSSFLHRAPAIDSSLHLT
jgi:hypothetical protein